MAKKKRSKSVETITHDEAKRRNIPTAEYQSVMRTEASGVTTGPTPPAAFRKEAGCAGLPPFFLGLY